MFRYEGLDGLELDDDLVSDHEVEPVHANLESAVEDGHGELPGEWDLLVA